jgi:pilus assembly protein CpaF
MSANQGRRAQERWLSPLQEIEQAAQEQAKRVSLDMATEEGPDRLRAIIDTEVARWSDDYKHGLRSFDLADPELVAQRAYRNLAGYGPLEPLLDDDDVWEVMINAPDLIFAKRHRGDSGYHDEVFHDDDHVMRILTKILDDSSASHRKLDAAEGLQDAQLDTGARMHIVHSDIGRDNHVLVNIRKFTGIAFHSLDELVERGTLDDPVAAFLRACVRARLSIIFAGAPGSGKTTLMSCCAAELDPSLRVVVAEEVFETDLPLLPNVAHMQTRPPRSDRREVDLRRLVAGFLRMAPDVAIVGEVRDREALPLLLTLSSGVKGFTTIHAGSARQALTRLRFICQLADTSSELPMSALNSLVTEAIDIVVHCRECRRAEAREAWPRMLEEMRLLTGSLGRSIPQALFDVGRRSPAEMHAAFAAAEREWLISTDFNRTVELLKARLADPTADTVCETLLVAYEVGGSDLDRRLAALADDRMQDLQGRKDARARQAGVRFARRFVLVVPLGMTLAALSIGTGRAAYQTAIGQALVVAGLVLVAACWLWAGRLMRLPEEERVFRG